VRTRPQARWVLPEPHDPGDVAALVTELGLPETICRLLLNRGHATPELARPYLRPRLERLHDPMLMAGMSEAVDRLSRAIRNSETILVHGDYDVDGMCSTTILTRTITALGGRAVPFIPRRVEDGYDLTDAGVRAALDAGARVVVTADCGTSAIQPIATLCAHGVDVIVTDHHLPGGDLPDCLAILNPRRTDCAYPDVDLAAAGVAFKLSIALTRAMGGNENVVLRMLDLVALATVADVAPLRGENRILVRYGLRLLGEGNNAGLRALVRSSGLDGKAITAGRVGFILAPRLNAVGRIGHGLRGVELLCAESEHEANSIARELEELNRRRQEMDRDTLEAARAMIERSGRIPTGIVVAGEGWHPGVIGIVASRLVEEYARPVILIALEGDEGKGSGRSIPAFDLHAGIGRCSDLLVRYGGHKAAAGVTIRREMVDEFARRFADVAESLLTPDDLVPELRVDLEIPLEDVTEDLEGLLRHFEPFGVGNPTPVFMSRGVSVAEPARLVGRDGLRLRLTNGSQGLDALGWGMGHLARQLQPGDSVDIAFRLERDEYRGVSRLQARLADIRR
jgi:single-stranded-DNA-specific exonuclease